MGDSFQPKKVHFGAIILGSDSIKLLSLPKRNDGKDWLAKQTRILTKFWGGFYVMRFLIRF
jgi:hypothetical protein